MNYPLISEYIEAIRSAKDNFDKLNYLRPVLDDNGNPVMSSGNFAVVFKMKDERDGKFYALKCFTRDQEHRNENYRKIAEELEFVSSSYLVHFRFFEKELFVDTTQSDEEEFPVLMMDWVEGPPLDIYLRKHLSDDYERQMLAYRFCQMGAWLLSQPFAHGDLKPDNILVKHDGTLVLVDYDGMYVPAMKGQKAQELGSPNFRHPLRTENDFNEHIDDFAIACIALSLKAISLNPELYGEFVLADRLLFSVTDYYDIGKSSALQSIMPMASDAEFATLVSAFLLALTKNSINIPPFHIFFPSKLEILSTEITDDERENAITDEFGAIYTSDGLKLIEGPWNSESYTVRDGTKIIGDGAFHMRTSLQSIKIPNSVTSIGYSAFWSCESLQTFQIPSSVTSIGYNTFGDCTSLHSIQIPNSVTSIGDSAFCGCESLHFIQIPNSVTNIGNSAFLGCESLQSIQILNNVIKIGYRALNGCKSLKSVKILSGHYHVEKDMLISSHGKIVSCWSKSANIIIPDNVTSIGNYAFSGCESLLSVQIPNSVISIGDYAFKECYFLESLHIPNSVTFIGDNAFWDCNSLQSIQIPNSITNIGSGVFSSCDSLQSIQIPNSVTSIGNSAFRGCVSLQSIQIPNSVKYIGDCVFYGCSSLQFIQIPNSVINIGYQALNKCNSLKSVEVLSKHYRAEKNMLISSQGKIVSCWSKSANIAIPDNVTSIGNYAFSGCKSLQSIQIPNSVISIGNYAFEECHSLQSIQIPDNVTSIGDYAFKFCSSLQSIQIPNKVTNIGIGVFLVCSSLQSILISNSATSIENNVFSFCCSQLPAIYVPQGTERKMLIMLENGFKAEE